MARQSRFDGDAPPRPRIRVRGDHDTFVKVWDTASSRLEQAARATLREISMTDAARAFAEATHLNLTLDEANNLGRSYVEEWRRHVQPIPGVTELIRQLARTLTVAVVSNTHDSDMVPNMLSAMGVSARPRDADRRAVELTGLPESVS